MNARVLILVLSLVGASAANSADPPRSEVEARVKVALALSRCKCEVPGEKCADGPDATIARVAWAVAQSRADSHRYEALKEAVARTKKPATFSVGHTPVVGEVGFPAGFRGYPAGVYQLTPEAGYVGVTAVAPPPVLQPVQAGPVCPDGRCPIRQ